MADILQFHQKRTSTPGRAPEPPRTTEPPHKSEPPRKPEPRCKPEPLWREVLGRSLRTAREARGSRLVDIANRAGISPQYLSEIERGRKEPSSEMIAAVTGALGVDLADLLVDISGNVRRLRRPGPTVRHRPAGPVLMAA